MIHLAASIEFLVAASAVCLPPQTLAGDSPGATPNEASRPSLSFVENAGQWDTPARFVASMGRTVIRVEDDGFYVDARPNGGDERFLLRFDFPGAREDARPAGRERLPGVYNYFLGNDPEAWRSGLRGHARVVYDDLYEGVDLHLREADGVLEYDLCLAPGADVSSVVVRCEAVEDLAVDERGGLSMQTAVGTLRQTPPRTWCVLPSGEEVPIECEFVVLGPTRFGFRLAERDPSLPVVIDPGLEWATYLGGSLNDTPLGMARKANGEIVVTGLTISSDFPTTQGVLGAGGDFDVFVSILDPDGAKLLVSTLLGGSGQDIALDVQVNAAGEVFAGGTTASTDFPVTPTALFPTFQGGTRDAWVAMLPSDLSQLSYSSYLGGSGNVDTALRLHVRAPHVLTVGGCTSSTDLPTTSGALQPAYGGGSADFHLWRLDIDQAPASQLLYCTYLGGSGKDGATTASHPAELQALMLHEDAAGLVTLAGTTLSTDILTTANGYATSKLSGTDAYLARIDPSQSGGSALLYGSFLGGSSNDVAKALTVDAAGVIVLGGWTFSSNFPTTAGALRETFFGPTGSDDGFVLKLDPSASTPDDQLLYSTFLAGSGLDVVSAVTLDPDGHIVGQGSAGPGSGPGNVFPTTCGSWSPTSAGDRDAFVFLLDPAGNGLSDLLYSTFVGGPNYETLGDRIEFVSTAPTLKVVGTGWAEDTGFPTTAGAYQENPAGFREGFVMQLELNPHTYCDAAPNSAGPDGAILCGSGSVGIADNTFTLSATGAPPNNLGLFVYGATAAKTPFGDGFLCLGSPVYRLLPAVQIDSSGNASRLLDFTQPPTGSGPGTILPGSTWYFQLWYRDPAAGGAGYNLSNGLKATFYP